LPIIILVEFRDYVAILGGLVGILATFTGIMWMLVQQINKRIDTVDKRIDDFRDSMDKRLGELRDDMDTKFDGVYRRMGELKDDMDRRFEDVYRRLGELRGEIGGLREEIKEIRLLLYKVLEVPHKQGE
jgi:predicted PurR-regulated permease PerM